MAFKTETQTSRLDWLKWTIAIVLFIAGIVLNYYYNSQPWPLRLLGWIVLLAVIVAITIQTRQGKQVMEFARESRIELKKVFWPTRQETMQATLLVGAMVIVLALALWAIDSGLVWIIGWLTGQRG